MFYNQVFLSQKDMQNQVSNKKKTENTYYKKCCKQQQAIINKYFSEYFESEENWLYVLIHTVSVLLISAIS